MKKYTMEDFKREKIAVTFANEGEQRRFLQECEKAGIEWIEGQKATEYIPPTGGMCLGYVNGRLSYGNERGGHYERNSYTVLPFSAFDFAQPAPAPSALNPLWAGIVTDATTAAEVNTMIDQLRKIRFDKRQKEAPAPEYDEVERPAKVGEKIKILDRGGWDYYKDGDVFTVTGHCNCGHPKVISKNEERCVFFDVKYVVLVPRKKEA